MSAVQAVLQQCGSAAGIGYWRFDSTRGLLHWPTGFGPPAKDESYGAWWSLGEFGQNLAPSDRLRFFEYFENLFEASAEPSLDFPIVAAGGAKIYLRLDGAPIAGTNDQLAAGIVRNVTRRVEAEERARATTALLEAMAATVSSGILVIDGQGRLRRANRPTFKLFGIDPDEGDEPTQLKILGNRIPAASLGEIANCRESNATASGTLPAKLTPDTTVKWRANSFGRGGIVVVFETVARSDTVDSQADRPLPTRVPPPKEAAPEPVVAPDEPSAGRNGRADYAIETTRSYLDYVHHPCLIIQTRDASIEYANRIAREKLGLKGNGKIHINNLFELSGRHAPRGVYVTEQRVSQMVTLPMGARVTRMNAIDPDLLFVEYI